jgi:hypothetical protein
MPKRPAATLASAAAEKPTKATAEKRAVGTNASGPSKKRRRSNNVSLINFDELFHTGVQYASDCQTKITPIYRDALAISRRAHANARDTQQLAECTDAMHALVTTLAAKIPACHSLVEHLLGPLSATARCDDRFVQSVLHYISREQDKLVRFIDDAHKLYMQYAQLPLENTCNETLEHRELRHSLIRLLCDLNVPFLDCQGDKVQAMIALRENVCSASDSGAASLGPQQTQAVAGQPVCRVCKRGLLVFYRLDAVDICQQCGATLGAGVVDDVLPPRKSHKGVPSGVSVQKKRPGYQRITFLRDWLRKVQAKSRKEVPAEVSDAVFREARRLRYHTLDTRTVHKLLKRLHLSEYYECDVQLAVHFNNVPAVTFSEDEIQTFESMFLEAEPLFNACPMRIKNRTNFLSYSFFLYKVCEMLGWTDYLPLFRLLRGPANLTNHNHTWEWMCKHKTTEPLWPYIETVAPLSR